MTCLYFTSSNQNDVSKLFWYLLKARLRVEDFVHAAEPLHDVQGAEHLLN